MTSKIKTRKTPEERQAQAEALHAQIAEQVEQLHNSDAWQRFLDFARAFHAYSFNNVMLIMSQYPAATRVAGFRKWQELGRQVRKGAKSIKIFGFREKKVTDTDHDTNDALDQLDTGERVIRYYPMLSVFDITQTELIDPDADDPSTLAHQLTGDDAIGILAAVTDYLTGQGWTVEREPLPDQTNGYTATTGTHRVIIDSKISQAQAAKTALHEAAHVILHSSDDHADYIQHRGLKETEAESVAYVVAGLLGFDTSDYSIGYVAGWSCVDSEMIKATATNVLRAAHQLADAITLDDSDRVTTA